MRKIFFTCGPSQLYLTVPVHIIQALKEDVLSMSHRGKKFQEMFQKSINRLKKFLKIPESYHFFFLSSSLESMERILENTVEKYSFHLVNGAFSKKFYTIAQEIGKKPEYYEIAPGQGFSDLTNIKIPKQTELICITHNETSTGAVIQKNFIQILRKKYPHVLIAIDIVSSVPYIDFSFSDIDCAFFSVQKGFGLPSGLSILIVSPQALQKSYYLQKKGYNIGSYHNFPSLFQSAKNLGTPETPNVLNIYLLNQVLNDMLKKGITTINKETEIKANMIYDFFDIHKKFQPFIKNPAWQSKTTITIQTNSYTEKLLTLLSKKGLIVSRGYGNFKLSQIRIANFPSHTTADVQKLLNEI